MEVSDIADDNVWRPGQMFPDGIFLDYPYLSSSRENIPDETNERESGERRKHSRSSN